MTARVAIDPTAFFSDLAFDLPALEDMRRQVQSQRDTRKIAESEAREEPADGASALRHAAANWTLSKPEVAFVSLRQAGDSPQAALLRGLVGMEIGDPGFAAAALGTLVGTSMEGPSFFVLLATAAALAGDADRAQKAASRVPEGADGHYAEGVALEAEGDHHEARRRYEKAVELDPNHSRALFRLALRADLERQDQKALEYYRRLAVLTPGNVNALLNLGLLYEDMLRYAEAETCYRRVLATDSQHVRARVGLKDVMASQSMYYDEDHERREDRRAQILRTPIAEFELSVRSRNCLSKMDINTLGDLVTKSEAELLAYKNFGETSLQEIKDILAQKNLRLGMPAIDDSPLVRHAARSHTEAQLDALFGGSDAEADADGDDDEIDRDAEEYNDAPIDDLELSVRSRRCMENLEIHTIGELLRHSEGELMGSKNFGQTSLNEIRLKLEQMGLSLKKK